VLEVEQQVQQPVRLALQQQVVADV